MKEDVIRNEAIFEQTEAVFAQLEEALDIMSANQQDFDDLLAYYESEGYMKDVEISNTSQLYQDISCGILSEDAVYDLIYRSRQVAIRMLELATHRLK